MNMNTFEDNIRDFSNSCINRLMKKNKEYSEFCNPFHNFEITSNLTDNDVSEVIAGFMVKHVVSIFDMLKKPEETFTMKEWDEKIGDNINYLLILRTWFLNRNIIEKEIKEQLDEVKISPVHDKYKNEIGGLGLTPIESLMRQFPDSLKYEEDNENE